MVDVMGSFPEVKHIIDTRQFSRKWIDGVLFPLADRLEHRHNINNPSSPLRGREMISLFAAESLRTRASFEIGFKRLGGDVIFNSEASENFSSAMGKGESIEDVIAVANEYLLSNGHYENGNNAVIVLRTNNEGDALRAANVSDVPIINGGDGQGQHPTQALLDLYAINRHLGFIDGLSIAMIGDLLASRTVHSLAYLLGRYNGVTIHFVSPNHKRIRPDIKEYLERHHVSVHEMSDVREIAGQVNAFYQTRTQTNLGSKEWDRFDAKDGFTIINKEVLSLAKKDAIILHPLPCVGEIVRHEVDHDSRAVYLKTRKGKMSQVRGGLFIRQALFLCIFDAQ